MEFNYFPIDFLLYYHIGHQFRYLKTYFVGIIIFCLTNLKDFISIITIFGPFFKEIL